MRAAAFLKKPRRRTFLSVLLVVTLLCGSILLNASRLAPPIGAEGSESITSDGGNRAYLEYGTHSYAGMERKQIVHAYVKAGETVYFGSCVANSTLDINHAATGSVTGVDIVVIDESGTSVAYDVVENGAGHIATVAMEMAGADIDGTNTAGYDPLSFTAAETGIYTFNFHSQTAYGVSQNPSKVLTTAVWSDSTATVAAWDVTVYDSDEGRYKTGRTFTECVAWNMGGNNASLNASVYVVTNDGYIYKTDFNGLDPYGFMFWASNRGLIDAETNMPLYRSAYTGNNELSGLDTMGVVFHNPYLPDSELDMTYRIFFEEPDPELEGVLYPTAFEPSQAQNFEFIGVDGNRTVVNYGGFFRFNVVNATSATITIDLTHVSITDEYGVTTVEDLGTVYLNNTVRNGSNSFYWDGCDGNGNPLPVGTYDNSSIAVSIDTHSGEYHFPFLDVENNPNGVIVTRMNRMYKYQADPDTGVITKVDVTDDYQSTASHVYYNNADAVNSTGLTVGDGVDASVGGVDSAAGVMPFSNAEGDYSAIDIWTYATGERVSITLENEIIIEDIPISVIEGLVFYDANAAGAFSVGTADFVLSGVEVALSYTYDEYTIDENTGLVTVTNTVTVNETTVTDSSGKYRFYGVESGYSQKTCTVTITRPESIYTLTTSAADTSGLPNSQTTYGTETQTFYLGGTDANGDIIYRPDIDMSDVGYYYSEDDHVLNIVKEWGVDYSFDTNRPENITVYVEGGYYSDAAETQWVTVIERQVVLNEYIAWQKTLTNLPSSITLADGVTVQQLTYRALNETFTTRSGTEWDYLEDGALSDYPYATAIVNEIAFDGHLALITNMPKTGTFQLTKRDSVDTAITLAGAVFELYIENADGTRTLLDTQTTAANGLLLFNNLVPGNYYYVEVTPPAGYFLDTTGYEFEMTGVANIQRTIYNTRAVAELTLIKSIDAVVPKTTSSVYTQFTFTVTWSENSDFTDAHTLTLTQALSNDVLSYTVLADQRIPALSYVKVEEAAVQFYTYDSASSAVTADGTTLLSPYALGDVFRVAAGVDYEVTLTNVSTVADTMWYQKVWVDGSGALLDFNVNGASSSTSSFSDVACVLQVSSDGGTTWTNVLHKYPASKAYAQTNVGSNEENITMASTRAFDGGGTSYDLAWLKRLGAVFWNLPLTDSSGNELRYRFSENTSSLPSGYALYQGEITYYETYAEFVNPLTGATTRLSYFTADGNTVVKRDYQEDMYIINYDASSAYSMSVGKIDGTSGDPLAGATFDLYRTAAAGETNTVGLEYNGTTVQCVRLLSAETQLNAAGTAATAEFSNIMLTGVDYYLVESDAPDGYRLLSIPKKIVLSESGGVVTAVIDDDAATSKTLTGGLLSIELANYLLLVIPVSGPGTTGMFFAVTGLLLLTAAAAGLIFFNCVSRKNEKVRTQN